MAHEWYEAAGKLRGRHWCLGLPLRTYELGHEIILRRVESPFVVGGSRYPDDLVLGCLVCALRSGNAEWLLERPGLRLPCFLWIWRKFLGRVNWPEEMARFENYLELAAWMPTAAGNAAQKTVSPAPYRLLSFLMGTLGMKEEEALEYPLARANVLFFAWGEMNGEVELASSERIDALFAGLEKLEREEAEGGKG